MASNPVIYLFSCKGMGFLCLNFPQSLRTNNRLLVIAGSSYQRLYFTGSDLLKEHQTRYPKSVSSLFNSV